MATVTYQYQPGDSVVVLDRCEQFGNKWIPLPGKVLKVQIEQDSSQTTIEYVVTLIGIVKQEVYKEQDVFANLTDALNELQNRW